MAGLSSLIANTSTKQTTLPAWYDSAQQDAVSKATAGVNAMPTLQNTLAGNAITQLGGANNPFVQAGNTAQSIATGAANPWNVSATGQVTPNTSTALGGLFQAQNQQLNQLMPNIKAAPEAGAIASGNFGSLRGQTAVEKALGDAQANLFSQQMDAALKNQATGVSAAGQAGSLANQNITQETALGQLQQMDPTKQAATLATILAGIKAPESVTQSTQVSPLNQIGALSNLLGGTGAVNSLLGSLGVKGGLSGLVGGAGKAIGNLFSGGNSGTYISNSNPAMDNRDVGLGENTDPNYVAPQIAGEDI